MVAEKITCPYCERAFDIDQVETADLFRERAEVAARLGKAWTLANEYLEAFRQRPGARISLKKRIRHLKSVDPERYFTVRMLNALPVAARDIEGISVDDPIAESTWLRRHRKKRRKKRPGKNRQLGFEI